MQLELFKKHPKEHLFPYWRKRLAEWPKEVFLWRHKRDTSAWSMATQGFWFADLLHEANAIDIEKYQRLKRFNKRVEKLECSNT